MPDHPDQANQGDQRPIYKGEQAKLRALHHLSDDALGAIAAEQMTAVNQALMGQLMVKNSKGELSREEQEKLAGLVDRGDQLMLRKAETAVILVQLGIADSPEELMIPHV